MCQFSILEKAPLLGLKLTSVYILGDDLSPLNVARSYFGEKASGTSAVTAVMYAGTAQSLNGLAHDLLASEPFTKAVICVVPELVYSLRLVAGLQTAFLFRK